MTPIGCASLRRNTLSVEKTLVLRSDSTVAALSAARTTQVSFIINISDVIGTGDLVFRFKKHCV